MVTCFSWSTASHCQRKESHFYLPNVLWCLEILKPIGVSTVMCVFDIQSQLLVVLDVLCTAMLDQLVFLPNTKLIYIICYQLCKSNPVKIRFLDISALLLLTALL